MKCQWHQFISTQMAWVQEENLKDVVMSGLGDIQFKWAHFK